MYDLATYMVIWPEKVTRGYSYALLSLAWSDHFLF